ncbi:2097_t:CDS:2, partial [Gigaspora margarita]
TTPHKGKSASGTEIPLLDPLFEVYVAKRKKKDNGEVEEIEIPEERMKAAKDPVHKKKKNKKANITYAQLFQVASNIRKEMNKITRIGRIAMTKVAKFCLKQDKEEKTISIYCEAQELDILIDRPSIVVIVRVHGEQKRPLGEVPITEPEGELDMSEEETATETDESDSNEEYKDENLKEDDFKLECIISKQETRLRAILTKYKSAFKEKSEQFGRTSITQHEIYIEDGPPIKQKFYLTSKPEYEFIKAEIQCIEEAGYEISQQGIVPKEVKIKTVKKFLLPKNLRALRGF